MGSRPFDLLAATGRKELVELERRLVLRRRIRERQNDMAAVAAETARLLVGLDIRNWDLEVVHSVVE